MVPETVQRPSASVNRRTDDHQQVGQENLVVRNYDERKHRVSIELIDPAGETVFRREYMLAARETIRVASRLDRAVYRVRANLDGERAVDRTCLVGGGPTETALVEVGNGLVSVAEGSI